METKYAESRQLSDVKNRLSRGVRDDVKGSPERLMKQSVVSLINTQESLNVKWNTEDKPNGFIKAF